MSRFYFIQIRCYCSYNKEWFTEHGMLEDIGGLVLYQDDSGYDSAMCEIYESLDTFKKIIGEKYIQVTRLS